jgi:uncharacterized membrane protein
MDEPTRLPLAVWSDFYVIVGSSAAALTGLQFVVIALINDFRQPASEQTIAAFSTPTVVHFAMALLISAILTTPWPAIWHVSVVTGLCAAAAFVYSLVVLHRARRQTQYKPVLEDWIWHVALPLIAYGMLTVSAVLLGSRREAAPFGIGACVLLLVFIGIHNAWDTVTYLALRRAETASPTADNTKRTNGES